MKKRFTFMEHTADVKFKAFGKSLEEVFESCALAFSEIISRGEKISGKKKRDLVVEGKDNEELLYGFLDELIYLLDAKDFVVKNAKVKVSEGRVEAEVLGDLVDNYDDLDHVKAATFAEMYVREVAKDKWEAQVVLDV